MKALLPSGLVLALGLLAARSPAQEVQWRASGTKKAPATGATATASPATAPSATIAPAPSTVPLGQPLLPANPPAMQRVDFRPVFRAKNEEPKPLPSGPALGASKTSGDSIKVIVDDPNTDG